MPHVNWSDVAVDDVKGIGRYIGEEQHRPSIAARIMREIGRHCDMLRERPTLERRVQIWMKVSG